MEQSVKLPAPHARLLGQLPGRIAAAEARGHQGIQGVLQFRLAAWCGSSLLGTPQHDREFSLRCLLAKVFQRG